MDPNTNENISLQDLFVRYGEKIFQNYDDLRFISQKYQQLYNIKRGQLPENFDQKCICCRKFFYKSQNLYFPQACQHIIQLVGSVWNIEHNKGLIKYQICDLLNKNGGVLLFNCAQRYIYLMPKTGIIIEKEKKQIKEEIQKLLFEIDPNPKLNQHIFISWVPIVKSSTNDYKGFNNQDKKSQLNYIAGHYIARVVVKPGQDHKRYSLTKGEDKIFSKRTQSQPEILNSNGLQAQNKICGVKHDCKQPDKGIQVQQRREGAQYLDKKPYAFKGKQKNNPTLQKRLLNYNITSKIQSSFDNTQKTNIFLLHHNHIQINRLQSIIRNNNDFQIGGQKVKIIDTTKFIRLCKRNKKNPMTFADFERIRKQLNDKYPQQGLKLWRFVCYNMDQQFYIQIKDTEAALYLMRKLEQNQEKCDWANPKGLQRMSEKEREERFNIKYQSK